MARTTLSIRTISDYGKTFYQVVGPKEVSECGAKRYRGPKHKAKRDAEAELADKREVTYLLPTVALRLLLHVDPHRMMQERDAAELFAGQATATSAAGIKRATCTVTLFSPSILFINGLIPVAQIQGRKWNTQRFAGRLFASTRSHNCLYRKQSRPRNYHFIALTFRLSFCTDRSAIKHFSRAFLSSDARSRLASDTSSPPYLRFQLVDRPPAQVVAEPPRISLSIRVLRTPSTS